VFFRVASSPQCCNLIAGSLTEQITAFLQIFKVAFGLVGLFLNELTIPQHELSRVMTRRF
jgi:hypothetical protein